VKHLIRLHCRDVRFSCIFVLALILIGCKRSTSVITGTWSASEPIPIAAAFSRDGAYQIQMLGDNTVWGGTYRIDGKNLLLHPAGTNYEMSYEMTVNGDDLSLRPVTSPMSGANVPPEMAKELIPHLHRIGDGEKLDPAAIAKATQAVKVARAAPPRDGDCVGHLKQIALAVQMYSEDYDQMLPSENWQRSLEPYLKDSSLYNCPTLVDQGSSDGYALNLEVAARSIASFPKPETIPLIFDSIITGPSAVGAISTMPSPARHPSGNSIAYLDGHAAYVP